MCSQGLPLNYLEETSQTNCPRNNARHLYLAFVDSEASLPPALAGGEEAAEEEAAGEVAVKAAVWKEEANGEADLAAAKAELPPSLMEAVEEVEEVEGSEAEAHEWTAAAEGRGASAAAREGAEESACGFSGALRAPPSCGEGGVTDSVGRTRGAATPFAQSHRDLPTRPPTSR